jgi:hypothetical protein
MSGFFSMRLGKILYLAIVEEGLHMATAKTHSGSISSDMISGHAENRLIRHITLVSHAGNMLRLTCPNFKTVVALWIPKQLLHSRTSLLA